MNFRFPNWIMVCFIVPAFLLNAQDEGVFRGCKRPSEHQWQDVNQRISARAASDFNIVYSRMNWNIDPAVNYISGTVTHYFTPTTNSFAELQLDLSPSLKVNQILYHGNILSSFTHSAPFNLNITLPSEISAGSLDSISISYAGVPTATGFGSFIQSDHNGVPVIWTLSEPYGAQEWWPCKNGLDDKIDSLDIFVTCPKKYKAASNGSLQQITDGTATDHTYHWRHRYPIASYLVAIAVTNYEVYTDDVILNNGTAMPMLNYVYPENLQDAKSGTANLVQVLRFYDSLFVTYPFAAEKYGHAQFGWGGGMEHQTMSFVTSYGWGLLSHELAHQWFGDMVTCGSWEDIWLNEGFATYLEGLTRERFVTEQNYSWYNWKEDNLNYILLANDGSVLVDDTSNVGRIFHGRLSYAKGAYLLHMLRWKLGDANFFQGVRDYLRSERYSFGRTHELQKNLENSSRQNLSELFSDWFEGQGFPRYFVEWNQDVDNKVYIKISQSSSHPSVSFFEMPIPVLLKGQGKEKMLRLENVHDNQIFVNDVDFVVEEVVFDPELWILCNNGVSKSLVLGLNEGDLHSAYEIYPNPTNGMLFIDSKLGTQDGFRWSLRQSTGSEVRSGYYQAEGIDLSELIPGVYVLDIQEPGTGNSLKYKLIRN